MSASLHLNLLKESELRTPFPVRLRVFMPMASVGLALGCLVWWLLLAARANTEASLRDTARMNVQDLSQSHAHALLLRAQATEASAIIRQLRFYEHACIRFGDALANLPAHVPANIQLTEMRVPPPPQPLIDPKQPALGPTNSLERVTLRIAGRTAGEKASSSVDTLLAALRTPAFTNLIQTAEIPKGAFRQDTTARNTGNRDTLLFEITCGCLPRRFE